MAATLNPTPTPTPPTTSNPTNPQPRNQTHKTHPLPAIFFSCNDMGRVSCFCSLWSNGDVGCRSCAKSGRTFCKSCGGSGTGRPLSVQISIRPPTPPS
ncbi:hypothetical protein GBA52_017489 [Prunus armeniaca]|nr:hypothetical protein GBA52_017489 [Prunus armeniaca]